MAKRFSQIVSPTTMWLSVPRIDPKNAFLSTASSAAVNLPAAAPSLPAAHRSLRAVGRLPQLLPLPRPHPLPGNPAVLARLERVVFGAFDPKAGAVGSLWDVVRDRRLNHRPEVVSGVRAGESTALLDDFFAEHR